MAEVRSLILAIDSRQAARGAAQFETAAGRVTRSAGGAAQAVRRLITAIAAFSAVRAGVRELIAFDRGLIGVGKTADLSGARLEALGSRISALSRRMPVASAELLDIARAAGQLGVKGTDNLLAFTETIARLGSATDLAGEEAAFALARLLEITGEAAGSVGTLGSLITRLGNEFAATEAEIAAVAVRVAQAGAAFDISTQQATAYGAAFRSVGIEAELAGGAVGRTLRKLEEFVSGGGAQLRQFEQILGIQAGAFAEAFGANQIDALTLFIDRLGSVGERALTTTEALRQLGITNTRDVNVLSTIAARYQTLARAIATNADEASNVSALLTESGRSAESAGARLKILGNTFLSIFDSARGASGAIASFSDALSDAISILAGFERNADTASEAGVYLARTIRAIAAAAAVLVAIKILTLLYSLGQSAFLAASRLRQLAGAITATTTVTRASVAATEAQVAAETAVAAALGVETSNRVAATAAAEAQALAELKVAQALGIQTVAVRTATTAWRAFLVSLGAIGAVFVTLGVALAVFTTDVVNAEDPLNRYAAALDRIRAAAAGAADAHAMLARAIRVGDLEGQRMALTQQIEGLKTFSAQTAALPETEKTILLEGPFGKQPFPSKHRSPRRKHPRRHGNGEFRRGLRGRRAGRKTH
jgi:TP901 family phage tail tape measure protein